MAENEKNLTIQKKENESLKKGLRQENAFRLANLFKPRTSHTHDYLRLYAASFLAQS
jgi:hypothetical protein